MSGEKQIYELTQMMSDSGVVRGDVNHAAGVIKAMLREKYITPVTKAFAAENKKVRKNPCKEVRLLDAVKPFLDVGRHEMLERAVDALYMAETFRGLAGQMPQATLRSSGAQEGDGVYEVDEGCLAMTRQPTLVPLLALMAMMKSKA